MDTLLAKFLREMFLGLLFALSCLALMAAAPLLVASHAAIRAFSRKKGNAL